MATGTGYFRSEPRKFSYVELARMVRGQGSPLLMWILKTLGISWHSAWARKYPEAMRDWVAAPEELPDIVLKGLSKNRPEMNACGFHSQAFIGQKDSLYPADAATELYLHESGQAIAAVSFARSGTSDKQATAISSALEDGRVLVTTNRAVYKPAPGEVEKEARGATATKLWEKHSARLAQQSSAAKAILDREAVLDFQQRNEQAQWDSLIRRGIMVECTAEEVEEAKRRLAMVGAEDSSTATNPNRAVMLEMIHTANRKQTRKQILWAFTITLALFVIAGYLRWEIEFLWMLVGALVIHELGHYLTMRIFGYQNLRMIFVPLGGAAVIGRNYNIAGWKKAIVSLMGPLPGILAASICAVLAWRSPQPTRDLAAVVALAINGINMLPFFPMDGGAYLNAILFCRNAKWELAFKAVAVIALASGAIYARDYLLGALAYLILVGLRPSYRLGKLTESLRREITIPSVNDPNELPLDIRSRVIDGVKLAMVKPTNAKTIASHTLAVFERLNARPPGLAGTTILLLVYFLTLGMAAVGLGGLFAAKARTGMAAQPTPDLLWDCAKGMVEVRSAKGADRVTGVTLGNVNDRDRFMADLTKNFPTNAPFFVGQTVFIPYSTKDGLRLVKLLRRYKGRSVLQPAKRAAVSYWTFEAESEESAEKIEDAINNYLQLPGSIFAYAPWALRPEGARGDGNEIAARKTIRDLKEAIDNVDETNSTSVAEHRLMEITEIQSLVATNHDGLDMATVRWYTNYLAATNRMAFLKATGRDGALRLGSSPRGDVARDVAMEPNASVYREGKTVHVDSAEFARIEAGLAAFGNWLCSQNCSNIFYALRME